MKVVRNILMSVCACAMVSCMTMQYSFPLDERFKSIWDECRNSIFLNSLEGLSYAVKWQKINAIEDEAMRDYFMNTVFYGIDIEAPDESSLKINGISFDTRGTDILEEGAVWSARLAGNDAYGYRMECLGGNRWRVTGDIPDFESSFYAPKSLTFDFVISASEVTSYEEMEFVYRSGSGKIEDRIEYEDWHKGEIEAYIEDPVSAVVVSSAGDNSISLYNGALTITADVDGLDGFVEQVYYADLSAASKNEHIVRFYHNGIWNSYAW